MRGLTSPKPRPPSRCWARSTTTEATLAATRQEILDSLVACLEAKEQASDGQLPPAFSGFVQATAQRWQAIFVLFLSLRILWPLPLLGTRQEMLDGFVVYLEAKEHAASMQASMELDALGAAGAGAVPKLVELGRTSENSDVATAAIEALDPRILVSKGAAPVEGNVNRGDVRKLEQDKNRSPPVLASL